MNHVANKALFGILSVLPALCAGGCVPSTSAQSGGSGGSAPASGGAPGTGGGISGQGGESTGSGGVATGGASAPATSGVTGSSACPADMATIPGGTWTSKYNVKFVADAFCLDLTEVTVDAYRSCVTAGACSSTTLTNESAGGTAGFYCNWSASGRGNHPINCVDWNKATAFCQQAGKRLPTETELDWAARDGDHGYTYPWGNDAPSNQLCWSGMTKLSSTCPVGSYPAGNNRYGVADLLGNVLEWTSSSDPRNQGQYYAVGGSWATSVPGDLVMDGLLEVGSHLPSTNWSNLGFRCAR
jgi:formylglycine-generating enzyme required for sulfatase activity